MPTGDQTKFNHHRNIFMPSYYGTVEHHVAAAAGAWVTLWAPGANYIGYINSISVTSQNWGAIPAATQVVITDSLFFSYHRIHFRNVPAGGNYFDHMAFPVPITLLPTGYSGNGNHQLSIYTENGQTGIWVFCSGWKIDAP